jgi:deoxyribonuclease-4
VATCFDTCHVSSAGYDLSTRAKARGILDRFEKIVGKGMIRCFHINDSKEPIGSHKDRHEHIGDGCVGSGIFEYLMNGIEFQTIPMILETAKTTTANGTPMDTVNRRRLLRLIDNRASR